MIKLDETMPELPEVETIADNLRHSIICHAPISDVKVHWPKTFQVQHAKLLIGRQIQRIRRVGKWLIFHIDKDYLLIHLRMSGKFCLIQEGMDLPHGRVCFTFANKMQLHFIDPRKFGRMILTSDPLQQLSRLGPDPLSANFTFPYLKARLKQSARAIKPFLLDQNNLAGLGNIYVDEVLWEARIHPKMPCKELKQNDCLILYRAIINILQQAISKRGTSLGRGKTNFSGVDEHPGNFQNYLKVYKQEGKACQRCGEMLVKETVFGRGTHFCRTCQNIKAFSENLAPF